MEKLIKIKARMMNGAICKFRTTGFTVKASFSNVKDSSGKLYLKLAGGSTFVCKNHNFSHRPVIAYNWSDGNVLRNKLEK